jgi:hypothetical protein
VGGIVVGATVVAAGASDAADGPVTGAPGTGAVGADVERRAATTIVAAAISTSEAATRPTHRDVGQSRGEVYSGLTSSWDASCAAVVLLDGFQEGTLFATVLAMRSRAALSLVSAAEVMDQPL